jgi:hypothetical protein
VAFWVYLPGQNDTHSRIAVLFSVKMVRFNRLGDLFVAKRAWCFMGVVFVLLFSGWVL